MSIFGNKEEPKPEKPKRQFDVVMCKVCWKKFPMTNVKSPVAWFICPDCQRAEQQ